LQSDYILSIVPPRDVIGTAKRFATQWLSNKADRATFKKSEGIPELPLYYVDLNAISPSSATSISTLFAASAPEIRFVDGGIIGGPPNLTSPEKNTWYKPSLVCSGPDNIADAELGGIQLAEVLNMRHVSSEVGSASGLKMCFASLNKGFTAIAIQAYATAHKLGVLPELRDHLKEYTPGVGAAAERGLPGMPPKAYRWIAEMQEIAETFSEVCGFGKEMFEGARDVYSLVADDTELGKEKIGKRVRGKTAEDVALLVAEGLRRKKEKVE
jgi:3-hydroxyisobutyrate dehydrogenase-like beta-hydroxyacid dehydrogenase